MSNTADISTVALLKGAAEGDITVHFASLLALGQHALNARRLGVLDDENEPTRLGHDIYHRHSLAELPPGRAYLAWAHSPYRDIVDSAAINAESAKRS